MKKAAGIIVVTLCCLFLVGSVFAGNIGKYGGSIKVAKQVSGTISSIDTEAMKIALTHKVEDKEVESKFLFNQGTSIMKAEEIKTIADLKKGDKVVLIYVRDGNENLAKKIKIDGE